MQHHVTAPVSPSAPPPPLGRVDRSARTGDSGASRALTTLVIAGLTLALTACGDDSRTAATGGVGASGGAQPSAGGGSGGSQALPDGGINGGSGGSLTNGGSGGSAAAGSGGSSVGDDAGVVDPPRVGDSIPGNSTTNVVVTDPTRNRSTACLHVDLVGGEFTLVPGDEADRVGYQQILSFLKTDEGFEVFGFFPWSYDFVVPDTQPRFIPEGDQAVVSAYDGDTVLQVTFVVEASAVEVRSVIVTGLPDA